MHLAPTKYIDYIFMKKVIIPIIALMLLISGFGFISHSATYISTSQKQIIRDSKRLTDLTVFRKAIENYKTKNGYYPKLESGTNIKGYVNSVWSSQWTSFCNLIGLSSCPIDPVNAVMGCDCSSFNFYGKCSGNNVNENINKTTCYNSKDQKFVCTTGSNIYQYKVLNNGRNYSLMMDFEYRKDGNDTAGADYWNVNDKSNGNDITIDNNCTSIPLSNELPKCGDHIMQFGEQCDGNDKVEFCTNKKGELGKIAVRCVDCRYEIKDTKLTDNCNTSDFCGDGIVNTAKGEQCDGGYEKMCFNSNNSSLGKYDWFSEKLRFCQSNCKWDKSDSYRDSLTTDICGGYCGDDKVQSNEDCDFGTEYSFWDGGSGVYRKCSDYNSNLSCPTSNCSWLNNLCVRKISTGASLKERHCYIRSGSYCKYVNSSPILPTIKNSNFSALSYVRDGANYAESVSSINETTLFVNKVSRNSVYLEFSLDDVAIPGACADGGDHCDVDGDEIMYKFDFVDKANTTIGFYKSNYDIGANTIYSSSRGDEITGKWIRHSDLAKINLANGKITSKIYFRIYPTSLSKNFEEANKGITQLIDGTYFGDYKFKISIKDSWSDGANVEGNKQSVEDSKNISFYIGSSCGDHVLQAINDEGQHEYCEWKPGYNKFTNWSNNEPSGNGNCATIKTKIYNSDKVSFYDWNAKWDDVPCSDTYYGICKKTTTEDCPTNWINAGKTEDKTSNICYGLTSKTTYDIASTECYYTYGKSYLVNILNPAENNLIKGYINSNKFTFVGDGPKDVFWIGFYNIKKLRSEFPNNFPSGSDGVSTNELSLWAPSFENGNPLVYSNAMYNGGSGANFSSQFLCSNTCNDIGGYCGDKILENGTQDLNDPTFYTVQVNADKTSVRNYYLGNFEQCDPTSQGKDANWSGQSGLGTGYYLQSDGTKIGDSYGCSFCKLESGYCGDGKINSLNFRDTVYNASYGNKINVSGTDYEHCDPRYVLTPEDSSLNNKDRGARPNYICASSGDIDTIDNRVSVYKIPNPKTEARMTWIANGKDKDGKDKVLKLSEFITTPADGKSFTVNKNGACQNSIGGYCGDGKIQMAYIGYNMNQNLDEHYSGINYYYDNPSGNESSYDNSKLLYNDKDFVPGTVIDDSVGNRKIVVGTSNYLANPYNYGVNNNNTFIGALNKFDNTANNKMWLEKCDPAYFPRPIETNNLNSGSFYKQVDKDLNYLANVNFNGFPTLRYQCNNSGNYACDFKTFKVNDADLTGAGYPIVNGVSDNDYSIGYCGDGVVTGYGKEADGSPVNINVTEVTKREQCDPKNHIVGPNGSDSTFGDNNLYGCKKNTQLNYYNSDFVFGKDCSSYITPETSNGVDRKYQCTFDCLGTGGYCGDGIIQDQFFEECDYGNTIYDARGVLKSFNDATFKSNYVCGVQNGYDGYSFDKEYQNNTDLEASFDSTSFRDDKKSKNGKDASCKTFGGWCGDGAVQVCNIGENFYGGSKNYNECYNLTIDGDGDYSFVSTGGATQIETCDSTENACFVNGGAPVLMKGLVPLYDFKTGDANATKTAYSEISGYKKNGAGKSGASEAEPSRFDGVCGTSNNIAGGAANTYQLNDLCEVGTASAPTFDTSSKTFEWNCVGFNAGKTASCSADAKFALEAKKGECGSDSDPVCNEPVCVDGSKNVSEGEQCTSGTDCIEKSFGTGDAAPKIKICNVECSYKGEEVVSGQPCDLGRTCTASQTTKIKQKFSSTKAIKKKCNTGFAGDILYDGGNWVWTCFGINNGTPADCSASASLSVKGKCNSGTLGACSIGVADEPKFNNSKNQWEWKCAGFNGGDFDSCSKGAFGTEKNNATCVNGRSSISLYNLKYSGNNFNPAGLCSGGVFSNIKLKTSSNPEIPNTYTWTCKNANPTAPSSVDCTASSLSDPSANGVCGSPSGSIKSSSEISCASGYPSNIIYIPAFNKLKWDCKGVGVNTSNPVRDVKCSAIVDSVPIDGECGNPLNMFVSSSGVQNPSTSKELKDGGSMELLKFKLCESGYPTNLGNSDVDTCSNLYKNPLNLLNPGSCSLAGIIPNVGGFNKTAGNKCDAISNGYISYDCFNLQIKIPFMSSNLQIFHLTMPWQWKCHGIGDGAKSPNCIAFNSAMFFKESGRCGEAATSGKTFVDASLVMDRCEKGYSTDLKVVDNSITWKCKGFNEGNDATCSANLKPTGKIDGSCGASADQLDLWNYSNITPCGNGIFSSLEIIKDENKSLQWSWKCKGASGGKTVTCLSSSNWKDKDNINLITSLEGKCKNLPVKTGGYKSTSDIYFAGACEFGLVKNIKYDPASNKFKWNCEGSNIDNVDNCEVVSGF